MYFGSRESLRNFSIENILTLSQICRLHLTFYEDVSRVTYTLHIAHRGALQLEIKMTGRIQVDLISGYESESDFQRNQLNGTVYHYLCVLAATRWISSDSMASFSLPPLPLISSIFIIRSAISWTWTYNFLHFFAAAKCIGNEIKSDFHVFLHFHFASMLVSPFLSPSHSVSISI